MFDIEKSKEYISRHRQETIEMLTRFLATDVILFWSDERTLFLKQEKQWGNILNLLREKYAFNLKYTTSLRIPDNDADKEKFSLLLNNMSDIELTVCFLASTNMKSVLLGLLLAQKILSADAAFDAAFLEEKYQNVYWGEDSQAKKKRDDIHKELLLLERAVK